MNHTQRIDRVAHGDAREPSADYNYAHFRRPVLIRDIGRTVRASGIQPGEPAPDFILPQIGGGSVQLSALRGRPVLLHFGSYT